MRRILDTPVEVLGNKREEIKGLGADSDDRFQQMVMGFERMEGSLSQKKSGISHIVSRFDSDFSIMYSFSQYWNIILQESVFLYLS